MRRGVMQHILTCQFTDKGTDNKWHRFSIVYENGIIKRYIDGIIVNENQRRELLGYNTHVV